MYAKFGYQKMMLKRIKIRNKKKNLSICFCDHMVVGFTTIYAISTYQH
jgi:hypothetical protein